MKTTSASPFPLPRAYRAVESGKTPFPLGSTVFHAEERGKLYGSPIDKTPANRSNDQ